MDIEQLEDRITTILKENIDVLEAVDVAPDTYLISSGYVESYEIIEVIALLEETFDISVQLADLNLEDFDTVASIAEVVARHMQESN